ncbi:hypothetical protein FACS1894123_04010 [Bacteroidia bacterium]|nr:hypothetical protein FACS1894123_04010 [Bacteroidia bacterium]
MKKIAFLLFWLSGISLVFADNYDFSALHGLRDEKGDIYFEISGYDILVSRLKGKINEKKTIDAFKKKQKINTVQAEYSDSQLGVPNLILETESLLDANSEIMSAQIYCLFQKAENEIAFISFQTLNQRDIILEQSFVKSCLDGSLSSYISDNWIADSVSFAGRTIHLGNDCEWQGPHNLSGKEGQISWSEFSTFEGADLDLDIHIATNGTKSFEILEEEDLEIVFEEIPTLAYRVVYKQKGDYTPLIVYYISQEVRGRYVSCILSNYGYNRNDYELSPLLKEFMDIPNPPEWADNPLDVHQYELPTEAEKEAAADRQVLIEIKPLILLPTGDLRKNYKAAPGLDFFIGGKVQKNMIVDIGFMIAKPVDLALFEYRYHKEVYNTNLRTQFGASARLRYQQPLKKNLFCSLYGGFGISAFETNQEKGIDNDGNKTYYGLTSTDFYYGLGCRYKFAGCFIEHHYAPYSMSRRVTDRFGKTFLSLGLLVGW